MTFRIRIYPYELGDLNWDDRVGILDVVYLINYLFKRGEEPCALKSADTNCNDEIAITDVVYLINYVFKMGPEPEHCP